MKRRNLSPLQGSPKWRWAALLVGVVLLLTMGATLIRIQSQPMQPLVLPPEPAPMAQATPRDTTTPPASTPALPDLTAASGSASAPAPAVPGSPTIPGSQASSTPPSLAHQAQAAADQTASQAIQITAKPRPVLPRTPEPAVARPPAAGTSAARPAAQ